MTTDMTMEQTEESSGGGIFRWIGLFFLFTVLLLLFTLVKMPQPKIHAWILGTLNQQLNPMGIAASAEEGHIELGLGLKYEMSGVRLTMTDTQKVLKFSRLEVAPNVIGPLMQGKIGVHFALEEGSGSIVGDVKANSKGDDFDADIKIENVNLGRLGILPFATGLDGTADLKGTITLSGSPAAASGMTGKVNLTLAKIVIDAQKFKGFDIPRTAISDGAFDIDVSGGKATLNTARLGKPGGTDDFQGSASGDIKLNKILDNSEANLRLKFGFSDRYRQEKTISLLDSLLGMFKKPDGSFGVRLNGPMYGMQPAPDL
ncbi:MAG: type II secretion system protein GspN [Bdellovibrionales bacterium]|nr:type II secretion system protein GspN [Bdellovibrionales bacterium]